MKRLLLTLLALFALFLILVFVFVPGKIIITKFNTVATTRNGFDSCLHKLDKWGQWWPNNSKGASNDSFFYQDRVGYKLNTPLTDGAIIFIGFQQQLMDSRIQTITLNRDSITAEWKVVLSANTNPFERLSNYLNKSKLESSMETVFDSLCRFASNTKNIYGFPIERTTFTEIILATCRFKSTSVPTTAKIYEGIKNLRQYIKSKGAHEKYYPMMNTKKIDSSQYETMIAISIDSMIAPTDNYFISQMVPMKDRFLSTEVIGGKESVDKANEAVVRYMSDHSLSAPGRPFEILITDRTRETDTSKWITKIYYPSM